MGKVIGIKSVDFKIVAKGSGVVNWNGSLPLMSQEVGFVNNHTLPKLRGYTNYTDKVNERGTKLVKYPSDMDFKKNPLYVSNNCIRHHLFKDYANDLQSPEVAENLIGILASELGLLRGYVIPATQCKKKSPLLLEDFVDTLGNGNYEQFVNSGSKEKSANKKGKEVSNSLFSKTTFGKTRYEAFGSINIEELQFISLDNKFDRCALILKGLKGEEVAKRVQEFICSLNTMKGNPQVAFHSNYVRRGRIMKDGEAGLLLNQDAIATLVERTLELIKGLMIQQGKGYLYVSSLEVDYNDSTFMQRIQENFSERNSTLESDFAVYYEGV